ncbi:MAG: TetR/AcrR family transcriptional regulator [Actinomycetota bacterium]|nr:TetR/AcrR family transcriptional regulator [Actinomycetota bacterium]
MPSTPKVPVRARTPSQDVEQNLLDAAEAVLVREGLGGVTVRAVATEAGVAPMGVYNRFGSKDGLIEALVMRSFDLLREAVADRGETDPVERLRRSGQRYRQFALSHPQHYNVIFVSPPDREGRESPELEQHARAAFEALVGHVVYGIASGVLREGDPVDLAQQIWSTVHGAVSLELNQMVLTEDPGVTYEHLLDLLTAGLTR